MNLNRLLVSLLCLSLAGCATFKSPFDNSDPVVEFVAKPPRNGKGLVSVVVTPNTGKLNWQEAVLVVRKISPAGGFVSGPILLQRVPLVTSAETVAYIGKLFPGRYSVTQITQTRLLNGFQAVTDVIAVSDERSAEALVFTVESDLHTDAGRLIVNSAGDGWAVGWSSDRVAADDIKRGNPVVSDYLSSFEVTGKVDRSGEHRKLQAEATRKPNGAFDVQLLGGVDVVAGSRMASVLRRSDSGTWLRSRVGRFQRVLALAPINDGRLVFAGEDNLLGYQFKKSSGYKFRYIKTGGIPFGQFIGAHWSDGRGLLVLHDDGGMIRLFASESLKEPLWSVLIEEPRASDIPSEVAAGRLQSEKGRVAVAVYPRSISTSVAGSSKWRAALAPIDITDFELAPSGRLRVLSVNGRSGSVAARESIDGGVSWSRVKNATGSKQLPVELGRYEYVVADEKIDDDRTAAKLLRRDGSEARWLKQGRMPVGRFFGLKADALIVVGNGFDVSRTDTEARAVNGRDFVALSSDGGETWVRELER